jgi:non-ribosomal peptide synthetase component E (peptide arylation enzyme)
LISPAVTCAIQVAQLPASQQKGGDWVEAAAVFWAASFLGAVVAAPDARLGEHAAAVLLMRPGHQVPDLDQVRAHLEQAGLARQQWPEEVHPVDDFPRTPSGKIQKFRLRADIAAQKSQTR